MPAQTEEAVAVAGVFALEPGLFAISIGPLPASPGAGGLAFPAIQVSRFPQPGLGEVAILGADGSGEPWLGSNGGVVAVRSPPDGGAVVISLLGPAGTNPALPAVKIRRLDADSEEILPQAAKPAELAGESPQVEILLHIQRLGDRRFSGEGWAGTRSMGLGVEGFAINPRDGILPRDLEYQGFLPGEETPWLSGGELCGSRGQRRPLTGFALRLAPPVAERFDVVYSGAFGHGGIVGPRRNAEPCRPELPDDPLEAMAIRLVRRGSVRTP
jgi:hypothetical protein